MAEIEKQLVRDALEQHAGNQRRTAAAQQAATAAGAADGGAPDDGDSPEPKRAKGDVVDAEFEEVGESKS